MRVVEIPIAELRLEGRFRQDLQNIDELKESIEEKGLLQPITISPDKRVLAGGRRYTACSMLGMEKIPCVVRDTNSEIDELEIELIENLMRANLHWSEEAALIRKLDSLYKEKDKSWGLTNTAKLLGRSKGGISGKIQLATAMEDVPELGKFKKEDHARKALQKLGQKAIVENLREVQKERQLAGGLSIVEVAEKNYKIGDALEGLHDLASLDESPVYFLEVDPPYGVDLHHIQRHRGSGVPMPGSEYHEMSLEDYYALSRLCYTAAAPDSWMIFWHASIHQETVRKALTQAGWSIDPVAALWYKGNAGKTNQPDRQLGRSWEPFFVCWKGDPILVKRGRSNVFHFEPLRGNHKWHPAQRPPELMQEILTTFCIPGAVVCSPFLGSGSTLIACYKEQMKGFGWDLSQHYKDAFLLDVERHFPKLVPENHPLLASAARKSEGLPINSNEESVAYEGEVLRVEELWGDEDE